MRTKRLAWCGVVAVVLAGCVPVLSLQPLVTKETITFDEKLLGVWIDNPEKMEFVWEFARLESDPKGCLPSELRDRAYRVNVTMADDKTLKGSFIGCLVKLQGRLFLDLVADKYTSGGQNSETEKLALNALLFLPVHTFVRVVVSGDELKLALTDDEKLTKLLEAEPKAVQYDIAGDGALLLTSCTQDLQTFLTKYAADERLFPSEVTLQRKAAGAAQ